MRPSDTCVLPEVRDLPPRKPSRWGMCIDAAQGDTDAAREIRETAEARFPGMLNVSDMIDYNAGKSAKELLQQKLGANYRDK